MDPAPIQQDRYHRQMLLPSIGQAGQRRLSEASVLLVGCGALGTSIAEQLVRAGVGFIRIADRDIVETTNLQRQVLFDEEDARQGLPKAVAAANRLARVNSSIRIDPRIVDVHAGNIEELAKAQAGPANLILDGTDNVETRYLINDFCVREQIAWIYGACVGTEGRIMPILPTRTPCLRCVFPQPPAPGELATCDTAGVLGPAAAAVAAVQSAMAIRYLAGDGFESKMIVLDLWSSQFRAVGVGEARRDDCPCCARRQFEFLDRLDADRNISLCGRDAVQIAPPRGRFDFSAAADRLRTAGTVHKTPWFVRCRLSDPVGVQLTVFQDGRLLVQGTSDPARARSLAARFVGA